MLPSPNGERYRVLAMGKVGIDYTDKHGAFGGDSFDYDPKFREEHLLLIKEILKDVIPDWEINVK